MFKWDHSPLAPWLYSGMNLKNKMALLLDTRLSISQMPSNEIIKCVFKSWFQVYYTTKPQMSLSQWESQFVDNNKLTTISDLTPHTIYTIRVEAYTSIGPGPLSAPVQVKTQQGVPSQPSSLVSSEVGSTSIKLRWDQPDHSGENIISYELYWNDTYTPTVSIIKS